MTQTRMIGLCCAIVIGALYVAGIVSGTILRHVVQTAPLWIAVALGFREVSWTRWMALPFFLFWLVICMLIWLFLLGMRSPIHGTFTPPEVAMTVVMGGASIAGTIEAMRVRKRSGAAISVAVFLAGAGLQWVAFRISMLPGIAHR